MNIVRLSNFTLMTQVKKQLHKLYAFIAILHFTVTEGSSIIRIIYILDGCEIEDINKNKK